MQFSNSLNIQKKYQTLSLCVISCVSNKINKNGFNKMSLAQLMRNICYIHLSFMLAHISHMQNKA